MSLGNLDKLILGTVQFGLDYGVNNQTGKPSMSEVHQILQTARSSGVRFLDTADAYGDAQEVLAKNDLSSFKILSKFIFTPDATSIEKHLKQTLKRLNVEKIHAYSFHRFHDLRACDLKEVDRIKAQGLVDKIGVSLYSNEELLAVSELPWIDIIQIPFNLLDNENQRGEALRQAKDRGKTIHVRSVFLQGLFFKSPEKLVGNLLSLKPYLQKIRDISVSYQCTIEEMCLAYVFNNNCVDGVILGVDSSAQLAKNLKSLQGLKFNEKMLAEIDQISVQDISLLNPANWRLG